LNGTSLFCKITVGVPQMAQQVPAESFKTGFPGRTDLEMRGLDSVGGASATD
jgi:hypothetical protein